jgi:hypothetical protein
MIDYQKPNVGASSLRLLYMPLLLAVGSPGCSSTGGSAADSVVVDSAVYEDAKPDRDAAADLVAAVDTAPPYEPEFQQRFDTILAALLTHHWRDDGDWDGDMQGDATAFAPMLLYQLGEKDATLWDKAAATARHELTLIKELAATFELNMDAVIGFPALAACFVHERDAECKLWLTAGTYAGAQLIEEQPEDFLPFVFDMATVFGTGATMCLMSAEALGGDQALVDKGLALIARADAEYWDDDEGLYTWSQVIDWPQATMMMALTRAYRITGDQKYLNRCERILESMSACCWDDAAGGYFGHWGQALKGLSGNNNMAWALLDLYESTGDEKHLDVAREIIAWTLSDDLFMPDTELLAHHWESNSGANPGPADYFCTGCNFATLVNIHRYHQLMAAR